MRNLYWTGVIIAAAIVGLFAASNRQIVVLGLWPRPYQAQAPLYLVVAAALLLGVAIGALTAWLKGGWRRRELRDCQRRNAALARELAATQAQLAREPSSGPPSRR